jgi:7-carboxy-7-deazaguanine synthase
VISQGEDRPEPGSLDFGPWNAEKKPSMPSASTLKINEIFHSIQGETTFVGNPTVFIRTTACNLRCTYCDTKYSYHDGEVMTLSDVLRKVGEFGAPYVCVTGGEPLLQKEIHPLMRELCDRSYRVSLETSGSKSCRDVDPRVKIILDVKTPDSGAADSFLEENLSFAKASTEFKFVICSEKDFDWSEEFCRQHDLFKKFTVLYSPSFGQVSERWLAEKILEKKSSARLQLQLHKYIWSPEARGV